MCGTSTIIRAAEAGATGGLSEFTHGTDAFGAKSIPRALGFGGKDYTPTTLGMDDPKLALAQSGGAPLLTQIALGANVEDALAGYFGKASGADFKQYYQSLKPEEQSAIDSVRNQLTQIQSNTDLRNKAVQSVVNDFPNIATQAAQSMKDAKTAAGEEFDSATKGYIDQVLKTSAAKYAAGGNISSGAMNEASAKIGAQMGLQRLGYTTERGDIAYDRATSEGSNAWMTRYNEVNALRGFQQKMLGQGATQGFSAAQARLSQEQQTKEFNANATNKAGELEQEQQGQLFGAIGSLGGTYLGYKLAGLGGGTVKPSTLNGGISEGEAPGIGPISGPRNPSQYRPVRY